MIKKRRNRKGFTLAELLVVVAIISVLVAVSIPVFSKQLEKSREATDLANVRSAYAQVKTAMMSDEDDLGDIQKSSSSYYMIVDLKQKEDDWQTDGDLNIGGITKSDNIHWLNTPKANGAAKIKCKEDGTTYINWDASPISMKTDGPKAKYAPTLNALLNVLKNEAVEELREQGLYVGYILIGNGKVAEVNCYKDPSNLKNNTTGSSSFNSEQLAALNKSIEDALSKENYRIASNQTARIFFDRDGNVVSGLDENGKAIGIGGQSTNASIKLSSPNGANIDATTLSLKQDDIWH